MTLPPGTARRERGRGVAALLSTASLLLAGGAPALGQSATPGSTISLGEISVQSDRPAGTAPTQSTIEERFRVLPGGVTVVPQQDVASGGNPTVARALDYAPGVVVQSFFGGNDQPRIQIRGSGLQQNPVERGILMLQDGLPLNRADGSYIVGLANPAATESIEVYRGYMANRLGATVLGGALNFVSPTGSTRPGAHVNASFGSFGQLDVQGQYGFRQGNVDGFIQANVARRDGFREYNSSHRVNLSGNIGVAWSEHVTTRFFLGYTDLGFDVAGPLTKAGLYADPTRVHRGPVVTPSGAIDPGPNVIRDRPRREASQVLIGQRTTATFGAHLFDIALGYTYTDDMFRFPISAGVRTTKGGDATGLVRYAYNPAASLLPLFETTAQYTVGTARRGQYLNESGVTGAQFADNRLSASTLSLHAGFNVPLAERLTLSPAIAFSHATRGNDDIYGAATRPTNAYSPANPTVRLPTGAVAAQDTSYSRTYSGWTPSLALSFRPDDVSTLFAAVSRSFEPPTHDDLFATINGTPNSSPGRPNPATPMAAADAFRTPDLRAQTATTVEAGWRGRTSRFFWDVVTYYSWINNELLSLRDATGASLGAINADRTRHFGVEAGVGARITDSLSARLAYTFQDFRFVNDPVRGNNRLAGAPAHLIHAALTYQVTDAWMVQGSLRWSPTKTPVDNMNTLYSNPYVVVNLRTEYRVSPQVKLFAEITNVFNAVYASSTLIVDQARPDQAAFLPGDGRGFYAGVKTSF